MEDPNTYHQDHFSQQSDRDFDRINQLRESERRKRTEIARNEELRNGFWVGGKLFFF